MAPEGTIDDRTVAELNLRAVELTERKEFVEAARILENLIQQRPNAGDLHYNLAIAYEGMGDYGAAERALRNALTVSKEEKPEYLLELAYCLFEMRRLDEAEALCRRAVEKEPASARAWNVLGVLSFVQERYEEARACFERAVELDPGYEDAWFNLADTYEELGEEEKEREARERFRTLRGSRRMSS